MVLLHSVSNKPTPHPVLPLPPPLPKLHSTNYPPQPEIPLDPLGALLCLRRSPSFRIRHALRSPLLLSTFNHDHFAHITYISSAAFRKRCFYIAPLPRAGASCSERPSGGTEGHVWCGPACTAVNPSGSRYGGCAIEWTSSCWSWSWNWSRGDRRSTDRPNADAEEWSYDCGRDNSAWRERRRLQRLGLVDAHDSD